MKLLFFILLTACAAQAQLLPLPVSRDLYGTDIPQISVWQVYDTINKNENYLLTNSISNGQTNATLSGSFSGIFIGDGGSITGLTASQIGGLPDAQTNAVLQSSTVQVWSTNFYDFGTNLSWTLPGWFTNFAECQYTVLGGSLTLQQSFDGTNWFFPPSSTTNPCQLSFSVTLMPFFGTTVNPSLTNLTVWQLTRPDLLDHTNDTYGQWYSGSDATTPRGFVTKRQMEAAIAGAQINLMNVPLQMNGNRVQWSGDWDTGYAGSITNRSEVHTHYLGTDQVVISAGNPSFVPSNIVVSVSGTNIVLTFPTNGVTSAVFPVVTPSLTVINWQILSSFTTTYPTVSNGTYSITFPKSATMGFIRAAYANADSQTYQTFNGAQAIGSTNAPAVCAVLDLQSTNQVFLPPRMTQTARDAITNAVAGAVVYQLDNSPGLRIYNGTNWSLSLTNGLNGTNGATGPQGIQGVAGTNGTNGTTEIITTGDGAGLTNIPISSVVWSSLQVGSPVWFNGTNLVAFTNLFFAPNGYVGVGTTNPTVLFYVNGNARVSALYSGNIGTQRIDPNGSTNIVISTNLSVSGYASAIGQISTRTNAFTTSELKLNGFSDWNSNGLGVIYRSINIAGTITNKVLLP